VTLQGVPTSGDAITLAVWRANSGLIVRMGSGSISTRKAAGVAAYAYLGSTSCGNRPMRRAYGRSHNAPFT
jgi:hypothetical protein